MAVRQPHLRALLLVGVIACGSTDAPAETTASARRPLAAPAPAVELRLLGYNLLYQYRQVPNADGSFPAWVCRMYPYVVDRAELRWEHRRAAIVATLEREQPDVLGLTEMRGGREAGRPVSHPPRGPPSHGAAVITDMTRWMSRESPVRYRWVSPWTLPEAAIELDEGEARGWPGLTCREDMSADGCASYDVRTDHYSTKSYLAFRPDRLALVRAGAFEIPTSALSERRFVPWARLREHRTGAQLSIAVVHLDAFSGAYRVAAARRVAEWVSEQAGTPVAVLGDFNAQHDVPEQCTCDCRGRRDCECSPNVLNACEGGATTHGILSTVLVDTLARTGVASDTGSTFAFRVDQGQTWRSDAPCWPRALAAEGRAHVGPVTVELRDVRVDYVLVSPDLPVVDARVIQPARPVLELDGERRVVHASDHLPVSATIRLVGQ